MVVSASTQYFFCVVGRQTHKSTHYTLPFQEEIKKKRSKLEDRKGRKEEGGRTKEEGKKSNFLVILPYYKCSTVHMGLSGYHTSPFLVLSTM